MCIAYLAIAAHPDWPLFIAANRDEFHNRPCLPAAPWAEHPDVIAGIDCQAQGSWLGLTRQGRYALITNYRDPASLFSNAPSRGQLVSQYLTGHESPHTYAHKVHAEGALYNGFNLIIGNKEQAFYTGNRYRQDKPDQLAPGRYIISNHLLNTNWPKAERLRLALDAFPLERLDQSLTQVFEILKDNTPAQDHDLPSTGLTLERERLLSSPFIISPEYGTRCSTIIALHASGRAIFSEISYDASGAPAQRHDWPFEMA
ncbi:Ser/Thr-rich protein T10 [Pusillimonas sp. T7-7]|uniref:NRDE family protein n=1 Tax=Pusillimonas sp. (strain T7-7) TaxID=1007105 RepID=UPI00020857FC|nr:NRDE family protein [Pusillimonas sp. T7-7]AEC19751.1 Ser/Thr-rich protein T10 [Pusillimonas sp. T7-7]